MYVSSWMRSFRVPRSVFSLIVSLRVPPSFSASIKMVVVLSASGSACLDLASWASDGGGTPEEESCAVSGAVRKVVVCHAGCWSVVESGSVCI